MSIWNYTREGHVHQGYFNILVCLYFVLSSVFFLQIYLYKHIKYFQIFLQQEIAKNLLSWRKTNQLCRIGINIIALYMYTRACSDYHSHPVKPTPMAPPLYKMHTKLALCAFKSSWRISNSEHSGGKSPWLESRFTTTVPLGAAYDYRRYNQHMTSIIIYHL